jgi:heat shock protein HspQ
MSDAAVSGIATPAVASGASASACVFREAKFKIGDVVKHRVFPFRGVVFDVDPVFDNSEEWLASIPEDVRPHRDQPFYHLLAENAETTYVAYVSEQNLQADESGEPCRHPLLREMFSSPKRGIYRMKAMRPN